MKHLNPSAALLLMIMSLLSSKVYAVERYYKTISKKAFQKLEGQELIKEYEYGRLYQTQTIKRHSSTDRQFVLEKKELYGDSRYFVFDDYAMLINDSTLRFNKAGGFIFENDSWVHTDGQWVYAEFYNDQTGRGVRFNSDTVATVPNLPVSAKGLYLFQDGKLKQLTADQSEEAFQDLKTNGLYFLPNPGFLYFDLVLSTVK